MRHRAAALASVAGLALSGPAWAEEAASESEAVQQLLERVARLESELAELRGRQQADDVVRVAPARAQASIENGRPRLSGAEGASFALRGAFQFDATAYFQDDPVTPDNRRAGATAAEGQAARDLSSGTAFRRARMGFEGALDRDWKYAITGDFGGSGVETPVLQQAWIEYAGWKPFGLDNPLRVRVGANSWITGFEDATPYADGMMLERAAVVDLVRGLAAGDGRSGIGFTANDDRWYASVAATGGVAGNAAEYDEQTALIGRVALLPFQGQDGVLHVGASAHNIVNIGDNSAPGAGSPTLRLRERGEVRTDGVRLVDTGSIPASGLFAYGLELGAQWRSLTFVAENFDIEVDRAGTLGDAEFGGWYAQASWVATGERRTWSAASGGFGGVRPRTPFNTTEGDWGAFEIAARHSVLDLNFNEGLLGLAAPADGVRGGKQTISTLALSWYPNASLRVLLNYELVEIERLNPSSAVFATTPSDGAEIGQEFEALTVRSQLAF